MKRVVTVFVLIICLIDVMSVSGAKPEGGGGYQASLVSDIASGITNSYPSYMFAYNDKLYFSAEESGVTGRELWEYDGISAPKMTANIASLGNSSTPQEFAIFSGKLYFSAYDATFGRELFVYDGVNPPSMVMDINPPASPDPPQDEGGGPPQSNPAYLTVYKNKLYFSATDGTSGVELWEYDGINPPSRTRDINPGVGSSNPEYLTVFNNKLYFAATDGTNGVELWVYDGPVSPKHGYRYSYWRKQFQPTIPCCIQQQTLLPGQ